MWAIGAQTNSGVIFVDEGSTVRTNDDFIRVAWYSKCASFAADDSGGLFRFSLFDRSWDEIDRHESKILALASVVSK